MCNTLNRRCQVEALCASRWSAFAGFGSYIAGVPAVAWRASTLTRGTSPSQPGNRPAVLCPAQGPESSGPAALDGKAPSGSAGPADSGPNGSAPSTSGSGDKEALKESLFRETDAPDTLQMDGRFGGVEIAIATSFIEKVGLEMEWRLRMQGVGEAHWRSSSQQLSHEARRRASSRSLSG